MSGLPATAHQLQSAHHHQHFQNSFSFSVDFYYLFFKILTYYIQYRLEYFQTH